ncbi:MAG: N-acetyltransferase [Alphaproteobacteria bacterium]|nr:N-acetyltransferase [Alphaproteobacteria bacterium]
MPLRPATEADLPGILAIYNDVIATSTAVYSEAPVTLANRQEWFEGRKAQGFPVLVAEDAQGVAGFASFGDFRVWPCYRYSIEHSVHVRADARGKGLGGDMIRALINEGRAMGKHTIIGGIDAGNAASIALHEKLGFTKAAHLSEVGFKFGRWLDLVFMQRGLAS